MLMQPINQPLCPSLTKSSQGIYSRSRVFVRPSGGARNWFHGDNPRGGLRFDKKARDDRNPISPSFSRALGDEIRRPRY